MRLSFRPDDDADLIRARLRALLDQGDRPGGWTPDDDDDRGRSVDLPATVPRRRTQPLPASLLGRHRAPSLATRVDPGRRGAWALCVAGGLAVIALLTWTWLQRPRVTPAPAQVPAAAAFPSAVPSSSPAAGGRRPASSSSVGGATGTSGASGTVVVSVVGLVAHPGVVSLPGGARVADAVTAAGGMLAQAAPASVNLAAVLTDGQQIVVADTGTAPAAGSSPSRPVNLNTATVADLDALPGVGPVLAQRIVDQRSKQGRFASVDELADVPGVGKALYSQLVSQVRV